jgi:peptidoglycan/xylan/chitin deacetylase (PgdA/CDA1 family)
MHFRNCILSTTIIAFITGLLAFTPVLPASAQNVQPQSSESPPTWDGTLRRINVPILMYHYVSTLPPNADATRVDLTVEPNMFRAHMRYLVEQGYTTISLYQLEDALQRGTQLPPNPIILTFDDGYVDHYTNVFPILQEMGMTATFFIITGFIDANDSNYLTWDQISQMSAAGMSMESHTKTHRDLRSRDYNFLIYEFLGSLESLNAHLQRPSHMFAFPVGRYDDTTLSVLSQTSVWRAVTTENGSLQTTDNRLEMPRIRIHGTTGVNGLAVLLR